MSIRRTPRSAASTQAAALSSAPPSPPRSSSPNAAATPKPNPANASSFAASLSGLSGLAPPPTAAAIAQDPSAAAAAASALVAAHAVLAASPASSTTAHGTSTPAPRTPQAVTVTPQPAVTAATAPPVPPPAPVAPPVVPPAAPQPIVAPPPPPPVQAGAPDEPGSPGSSRASSTSPSDADSEEDVTKVSNRMDTRNLRSEKFTGTVAKDKFDTGAQEWWTDFQDEVDSAQILSGQRWSDRAKKLLLSSFFDGLARHWHKRYRTRFPNATYAETGAALVSEFRPRISYQDLTRKLIEEPRKFNEPFREYADRLVTMATNLEGGIESVANQRHALTTFVRRAWPAFAGEYERNFDLDSGEPLELLEWFIAKRRKPEKKEGKREGEKGQAHAAVVERKRKPPHKQNNKFNSSSQRKGQFACYKCGSPSHTAKYHDELLNGGKDRKYGPAADDNADGNRA